MKIKNHTVTFRVKIQLFSSLTLKRLFTIYKILSDQVVELSKIFEEIYLIIDISELKDRGSPQFREWLGNEINRYPKTKHIVFAVNRNRLIMLTIRFGMARIMQVPFSVHKNLEQALIKVQKMQKSLNVQ